MTAREKRPLESIVDQLAHSSLAGKYQLLARLGHGGMADVYLAVARGPLGFNKLVVIKRLREQAEDEGQSREMFLDEARLAARLNHPNIVDTYDVGQEGNSFFIAMEYLDGQPLSRLLKGTRRMGVDPSVWVYIVAEALRGLHHAHELSDYDGKSLQIVHRDVSPHNIFVTYEAEIKVVDFGIAKTTMNVAHTEAGLLKGKIGYMPPEQAMAHEVDRRADIFSMGVVLWEALAGRRMLEGSMATIFARLVQYDVPDLVEAKPDVDPRLAAIVGRALKKRPDDRYATAMEMREALLEYLRLVPRAATKADVAAVVSTAFGEQRAAVQQEIEKQLLKAEQGNLEIGNLADTTRLLSYESSAPMSMPGPFAGGTRRTASAVTAPHARHAAESEGVPAPQAPGRRVSVLRVAGIFLACAAAALGGGALVFRYGPRHSLHEAALKPSADIMPSSWAPLLETTPSGAEVSWNGQVLGQTPLALRLPSGAHTVIVTKEGYSAEPVIVDVHEAAQPLNVTLRPAKVEAPAPEVTTRRAPAQPPAVIAPRGFQGIHRELPIDALPTTTAQPEPVPEPRVVKPAPAVPEYQAAPPPGSMDAKAVAVAVRAHSDEIQACFDRALMDRADLHGRLTVQATIGPTGKVLSATVTNTVEGGGRLRACVLSSFQSWTFPAPAGGVNGVVTRTFVFEPSESR